MLLRQVLTISFCGTSMAVCNLAVAEQQAQQAQPTQPQVQQVQPGQNRAAQVPGQVGQRTQWMNSDQTLATCIAIANQEEVAIAKFAEEKTRNDDVKQFAKMMVKDHQAFLQKLQKFAPEASRDGYLNENNQSTIDGQERTTAVRPAGGAAQPGAIQQTAATAESVQSGQPVDFISLHREIAEECIRSAKKGMAKKDGNKFDECYIGHQIAAHEAMKTKLSVFERHATGELKQVISEGLDTTQKHLKKAEDLMKDLDSKRGSDSDKK